MHIDFGVPRQVEVDDVSDPGNVKATGCNVGRNHHFDGAIAEPTHDAFAFGLRHVAMESGGAITAPVQPLGNVIHGATGRAEHDRRARGLDVEDASQGLTLFHATEVVRNLGDLGHHRLAWRDRDMFRIAHEPGGKADDRRGHRRGEEGNLHRWQSLRKLDDRCLVPCGRCAGHAGQDCLDIIDETHVEHLVGLVEDSRSDGG